MSDLSWNELLREVEVARTVMQRFDAAAPRMRDVAVVPRPGHGAGRLLIQTSDPETQRRYQSLLAVEAALPRDGDHGVLIAAASLLLEVQVAANLCHPARTIAHELVDVLTTSEEERQAALLERWAATDLPATLGTASLVLLALRRGAERARPRVQEFLERHFSPAYQERIRTNSLGVALDKVRNEFRNPACHGTVCFAAADYARFSMLLVGSPRLATWDREGPNPKALADEAILVHQLAASKSRAPAQELRPRERLVALEADAGFTIRVEAHVATESTRLRDVKLSPARPAVFRVGENLRFRLIASRDCRVLLLDVGTSGAVTVLLPNAWDEDGRLEADKAAFFPATETSPFDFTVAEPTGIERIVAIATIDPLHVSLSSRGHAFSAVSDAELSALLDDLARLPADHWTVGHGTLVIEH